MSTSNIFTGSKDAMSNKVIRVIGGGVFWKKGSAYRNWKRRGYKILSNGMLTYYDVKTNGEKGTFNISKIKIIPGPVENLQDLQAGEVSSSTVGVPINIHSYDEMRTLEVIFFTSREVKIFCDLLIQASVIHNVKEFQDEHGFQLSHGDNLGDMSAPSAPEYCTVLEGVFLKLGHVRKGWKKRKFRIRKCTNYVGDDSKPGLLDCGSNMNAAGGNVISTVILGKIHVFLDENICKGSTTVVVTSVDSSLSVSVSADTTIHRRLKDISVILYTDGLKAGNGNENEVVDPSDMDKKSTTKRKAKDGRDHEFSVSPQILHFLAALKDACLDSNIEDIIHKKHKKSEAFSGSREIVVAIAQFVNRDYRAPILLSGKYIIHYHTLIFTLNDYGN
jgi:hypothetical protein